MHRRGTGPAAAAHRDPLIRGEPPARAERVPSGHEAAAEPWRRAADRVGQGDEVEAEFGHRDPVGECPVSRSEMMTAERPKVLTSDELAVQLDVDVRRSKTAPQQGAERPAYITLTPRTVRYLSSEAADQLSAPDASSERD